MKVFATLAILTSTIAAQSWSPAYLLRNDNRWASLSDINRCYDTRGYSYYRSQVYSGYRVYLWNDPRYRCNGGADYYIPAGDRPYNPPITPAFSMVTRA